MDFSPEITFFECSRFWPRTGLQALGGTVTATTAEADGKVSGIASGIFDSQAAEPDLALGVAVVVSFKDASGKQCTTSTISYMEGLEQAARDYLPTITAGQSIISQYQTVSTLIE